MQTASVVRRSRLYPANDLQRSLVTQMLNTHMYTCLYSYFTEAKTIDRYLNNTQTSFT